LDQIVQAVGGGWRVSADPRGISVKLVYEGREVSSPRQEPGLGGGELRLLSSPALFEGARWLVPVDTMPRVLGRCWDARGLAGGVALLVIGNVPAPRIEVKTFVSRGIGARRAGGQQRVPFPGAQERAVRWPSRADWFRSFQQQR
jgi:hypothetical protein